MSFQANKKKNNNNNEINVRDKIKILQKPSFVINP